MRTAFVYARVSSDEQAGERTSSLGDQILFCTQYAERNGFEVAKVYRDDFTGRVRKRPALMEMERDLARNPVDAIVAWNHKRIARFWPLGISLISDWAQQGIEVHVVNDGGKVDFANWNVLLAMVGQIEAHNDSNDIRDKTSRGRNRQVEEFGRVVCVGHPPYGYKIINKGLKKQSYYGLDEFESEIVMKIFQWYTVGDEHSGPMTLDAIGDRLDDLGIHPPRPPKKEDGIPEWRSSTLARILQNELYTGVFSWGKSRMVRKNDLQDKSERVIMPKEEWTRLYLQELAIVDPVTFGKAASNLKRNKELSRRKTRADREYLLSGHFFCGSCKRRMTGKNTKLAPKIHLAYVCVSRAMKHHNCNQLHKNISIHKADSIVWDWLSWLLNDEQHLVDGIQSMGDKEDDEVIEKRQRLERLNNSINDLDRRINGLIDDLSYFRESGCSPDTINSIRQRIEDNSQAKGALISEREQLERGLAEQSISQENIDEVMSFIDEIRDRLPNATFDDKRYLLRLFDVKCSYVSNGEERRLDVECAIPAFNKSFELQRS